MILELKKDLQQLTNPKKAKILQGFFKTGQSGYGKGDIFIGIIVPDSRKIALKYKDLYLAEIKQLLHSKIHEERLIAIFILIEQFNKGNERTRKQIYTFYLKNKSYVNNWDLVDASADKIVGQFLLDNPHISSTGTEGILTKLALSQNLWDRRIAIVSTYQFIKKGDYQQTLEITKQLLNDKHDLIHKACGWMLREVGKRDRKILVLFLSNYYKQMPRTMLRYAIEHFDEPTRKKYLKGEM